MSEAQQDTEPEARKRSFIKIPSYDEVFNGTQANPLPSLFRPSSSLLTAGTPEAPTPVLPHYPEDALRRSETSSSSSAASASASVSVASVSQSPYPTPQSRNAILVSHRQKGNPLLKHIRNVKWIFADVACDYLLGPGSCALYLSLRYHLLHPDYLYYRIRELQKNFKLRVVLCHVDVEDVIKPLLEVTRTALLHDCTLLCGWSLEECGRYLETIKVYENKSADSIKERMDSDYMSRLNHALTAVRHVNKNDVVTLGSTFGSLSHIIDASMEDLARCPGIGDRKVKRLYDTFHEPFKRAVSSRPAPVPEASAQNQADDDDDKRDEEKKATSEQGKESSLTVKSALAVAYAKYSEKIHKRDDDGSSLGKGKDPPSEKMDGDKSS